MRSPSAWSCGPGDRRRRSNWDGVLTRRYAWRVVLSHLTIFESIIGDSQPVVFTVSLTNMEAEDDAYRPDIGVMLNYVPDSQSVTNALMFSYHGIASAKEIREYLLFSRMHRRRLRISPSLWQHRWIRLKVASY